MTGDNPAARLHAILIKAKSRSGNQNCRNAWNEVLNISQTNESEFLMQLGKVSSLPHEIIEFVKNDYPEQLSTTSHWTNQVNSAFIQQDYNGQFSTFTSKIDNHSLNSLSLLSSLIANKTKTTVLPEDTLESMKTKINELINDLLEADLSVEFKQYLNRALSQILENINSYLITGINPIIDSIDMILGHAITDVNYREELKESGFGKSVLAVFHFLASFITVAAGISQYEDIGKFYLTLLN